MSFTYDISASGTALATSKVRLEIGDTDSTTALFTDEEIQVYVDDRTTVTTASGTVENLLLTAADLCDVLSNRFARQFDFAEDGQSFSLSQRSAFYAERARELRKRSGLQSVPLMSSVTTGIEDNILGGQ